MKLNMFSMLTIGICAQWLSCSLTALPLTHSIEIQFPQLTSSLSLELPAYYKGHVKNLTRWSLLPGGQPCSILIAESIEFKNKGNTIHYLKRNPDMPCLWFDLTLRTIEDDSDPKNIKSWYVWDIEERNPESLPTRIPEQTLIILANPHFIEGLVPSTTPAGSVDISLPLIKFKQSVNEQEFHDSMLSIVMGSAMDLNAIHSKIYPAQEICKECVIVSVAKPAYEPR